MAQVGGLGAAKPVDDEVRAVFDTEEVKAKVAEVLGSAPAKFEIHSYKTQVVAGVNYRVKVRSAPDKDDSQQSTSHIIF